VDDFETEESLDPTSEITLETVKKRAVKGVVVLTGRTFLLNAISLIATGLLTVFLSPSEFGVFWIVSAIVNFLAYFSDVGLAAALIQKKEKLSDVDLSTTFFVQQALVISLLLVLFFLTPVFMKIYSLSYNGKILLYALGFSFFLSSLKTIPSVILERKLQFGKLVIPQISEQLVYNIVAVVLAWLGWGIKSFTFAVLARGIIGLVIMYILQPWFPKPVLSKKSLKKLLTFGVPYQVNTLLATFKDNGMTVVLGGILGPSGIGLLGWAQKWGQAPLRFFMDHVIKVTFPAFARMQDEKEQLERSLTRSIFFISLLVFPSLIGLLILAPVLVQIIPRYGKWTPALVPLTLIGINTLFASVSTQLTNLFNAIGKIKTTFKLMVMWTVLSWLFIPILALKYSVIGAALGYALVGLSSVIVVYIAKKYVDFSIYQSMGKPFISVLVMGVVLFFLRGLLPVELRSVWILIGVGVFSYMVSIYVLVGPSIKEDVQKSIQALFSRR